MKKIIYLVASTLFIGGMLFSCSDSQLETQEPFLFENEKDEVRKLVTDKALSEQEIKTFQAAGFEGSNVRIFEVTNKVTGQSSISYEIDGDTYMDKKQLLDLASNSKKSRVKQFRTDNLVTLNRPIQIVGLNLEFDTPKLRQGLIDAVANYNALNIGLRFELRFAAVTSREMISNMYPRDILVGRYYSQPGTGASAGFPINGHPFGSIALYNDLETSSLSVDVIEHIITHEIGHCIGMRHTDYFNRSISCGGGGDEGSAGVGVNHIPGTPNNTNIDMDSVFLSCFSGFEDGEFSNFDITALEEIY